MGWMPRVDRRRDIPYILTVNAIVRSNVFKTGNSVAVRLPKSFGFKAGDAIEIKHSNGKVEIGLATDPEAERAKVLALVQRLRELGPVGEVQPREPIEFPDRPGLY